MSAVMAVPLALAAGMAIDYNRISSAKSSIQSALDSVVLAAGADTSFNAEVAMKFFKANRKDSSSLTISNLTFKSEGSGVILGTAEAIVPLGIMGLAGQGDKKITVTSRAKTADKMKMSNVEFQITNTQGAFDKEIYIFTKDKDGKVTSETLMMSYDYTYSSSGGTKVFTPSMGVSKSVSVGSYDTVGQKMVVYEDNSYRGKKVNPKNYLSDDKKASTWTKTKGECTDPGGQTQNWEDGGDSNYMDVVFTLKCTTVSSGSKTVRLMN
jgi:hypothetical protein